MTAAPEDNQRPTGHIKTAVLMLICRKGSDSVPALRPELPSGSFWLGELTSADRPPDPLKDRALAVFPTSDPSRSESGRMIRSAMHLARRSGMTHLITWLTASPPSTAVFQQLRRSVQKAPNALVNVNRFADADRGIRRRRFQDRIARFWFRIQTGLSIGDPLSPNRAYPLKMISCLKLRRDTDLFYSEVLVKAAWAGVSINETALAVPPAEDAPGTRGNFLKHLVFNVHWTLRSITPIPHRKIVADTAQTGRMISVWHPIRSIRALLTENLSPGQLAAAAAMGVFFGTLPLIACHSVAILFGANYFRLNKVAALTASQLCMPPVVPALCIEAGYYLRHGSFLTEISLETLGYQALDRLLEWLLGSLLLAPLLAGLVGGLVWFIAAGVAAKTESGDPGVRQ